MIQVTALKYTYPSGKSLHFPELRLTTGEQCLLLGESGSGKTTLLHLLGGLLKSQSGSISINATEITQLSEASLDHFRGKNMGFVFQRNHLITALTVEKNILLSPYLAGVTQEKERVSQVLQQLNLSEKKNAHISELSQGQAQRVAIARAVFNKPSIILADEPTSALDDTNCHRVIDLLLNVAHENKSILIVATHDQRLKSVIKKQIILN